MSFADPNGVQNPSIPEFDFKNPNSYLWTFGQFKQIDAQATVTPPPQDSTPKQQTENGTRDAGQTFRPTLNASNGAFVGAGVLAAIALVMVLK